LIQRIIENQVSKGKELPIAETLAISVAQEIMATQRAIELASTEFWQRATKLQSVNRKFRLVFEQGSG